METLLIRTAMAVMHTLPNQATVELSMTTHNSLLTQCVVPAGVALLEMVQTTLVILENRTRETREVQMLVTQELVKTPMEMQLILMVMAAVLIPLIQTGAEPSTMTPISLHLKCVVHAVVDLQVAPLTPQEAQMPQTKILQAQIAQAIKTKTIQAIRAARTKVDQQLQDVSTMTQLHKHVLMNGWIV